MNSFLSLVALMAALIASASAASSWPKTGGPRAKTTSIRIQVLDTKSNKSMSLSVEQTDTVKSVKAKIELLEKVPAANQTLFFNSEQLADEQNLQHYKIENNSTLKLVVTQLEHQFFVKAVTDPHKTMTISMDLTATVGALKTKIQNDEKIPTEHQYLLFGGKLMEDKRSLSEYNVTDKSTIELLTLPKTTKTINL